MKAAGISQSRIITISCAIWDLSFRGTKRRQRVRERTLGEEAPPVKRIEPVSLSLPSSVVLWFLVYMLMRDECLLPCTLLALSPPKDGVLCLGMVCRRLRRMRYRRGRVCSSKLSLSAAGRLQLQQILSPSSASLRFSGNRLPIDTAID